MNKHILTSDVQLFIREHLNADSPRLILQKSPFSDVSSAELASQIDSRKRSEKKLPLWFNTPGIYFPPKLSIEQSSSEQTAAYKSRLIRGEKLLDMTGGFGVDSYYFSKLAKEVVHCDRNPELSEIAKHNAGILGAVNIRFINQDSLAFLEQTDEKFDTIYVDPSRRVQSQKVFLLRDTEPDIVSTLPLLLAKAKRIIVKTSPLFDIQSGLAELKNVSEVHVVSLKNDCKELLWIIDAGFIGEPAVRCVAISEAETRTFSFSLQEEKQLKIEDFSAPLQYLYEPDVALLKAGCFKTISRAFGISKLNKNTHLYTSAYLRKDFIGRIFQVRQLFEYKAMKDHPIRKANILTRNFPLSPDEIRKKFKIQDGGDVYLIFCKDFKDRLLVTEAERLV